MAENAKKPKIIVGYLTDEKSCIERQLAKRPYVEVGKDEKGNIIVDFCLGASVEEAADVCCRLLDIRKQIENEFGDKGDNGNASRK